MNRKFVSSIASFALLMMPAAPTQTHILTQARSTDISAAVNVVLYQAVQVAVGSFHTCALTNAGAVKCWGYGGLGVLGDGTTTSRWTPVDVVGLSTGVIAISTRSDHTCALTSGGGVKCWGVNHDGQLGDGTTTARFMPVDVSGLSSGVIAISAGGLHTCALTSGGSVKCWGGNGDGALGDGTTTSRPTPVDVSGLGSSVIAITTGYAHTCALIIGGGARCWGRNEKGQLGDGTSTNRLAPVSVSGMGNSVGSISAGSLHTCAVTSGGGAKCWGDNFYGSLGNGTTINSPTPVAVVGLGIGVNAISAGGGGTCALTNSGAARCWGNNSSGSLGDGTTILRLVPVDVSGLSSTVSAIRKGNDHTCALTSGGVAKCWGYGGYGQLGDGTTLNHFTPSDVVGFESGLCDQQNQADSDGDGLLDVWEACGYDAEPDGMIDVNLPALGASPFHKDVFVEIDYMEDPGLCTPVGCVFGHSHRPKPEARDIVVKSFSRAPVTNPDGSSGINLHITVNEAIKDRPYLAASPGQYWNELDFIKYYQAHFDSKRKAVFHYALFVHDIGGGIPKGVSGVSRNGDPDEVFRKGASDLIVSLGSSNETINQQAGTLMHELGHNLGLRHGGDDHQNHEPNYLSVMNYSFQTDGLRFNGTDGLFDYSRFGNIPSLDENHLDETVGLNGGQPIHSYGTRFYCVGASGTVATMIIDDANGRVNWDCDLSGHASMTNTMNDINADGTYTVLQGIDDWSALVFNGGAIGLKQPGSTAIPGRPTSDPIPDELNMIEDARFVRPIHISLGGGGDVVASLGVSATAFVTIANLGSLSTTVMISRSSGTSWFNFSAFPVSVTVNPSMSIAFPVTLTIPPTRSTQMTSYVSVWATPIESPSMGDATWLNAVIGPIARFEATPFRGFGPFTVTFTDSSIGQITSRVWSFGDGVTSTVANPMHFYAMPGVYTATLTVTGPDGVDVTSGVSPIEMVILKVFMPMALR